MPRLIVVLAAIGVTIYAFIDCLRAEDTRLRGLPKPVWLLVIVLLIPIGGVLWVLFGRQSGGGPPSGGQPRVVAPDDDPDFLRSLEAERRRKERRGGDKGDGET